MSQELTKAGLILLMGGVGSLARYYGGGWVQRWAGAGFPAGTLFINVTGCLVIGFLAAAFGSRWLVREEYRVAVMIGFLGGYTTFSTFGLETFKLLNDGQFLRATMNVMVSVVVGILAVWVGYRLAERLLGA